ncbi:MAG TPA: hypothetical protein VFJ85_01865 [Acidimicrobiales bacterium]|nr:hypothetical protein [Acidimicrobiales bacterium]
MTSIQRALADSAAAYAHRAVDSFVSDNLADFYLLAGISIEHAMKARLARENIAFIAPDRAFTSALELWRTRDDIKSLPVGTKTIGGAEAINRLAIIEKSFAVHADSVRDILRFRNGEAHIGAPGAGDHRKVFTSFVAAINALLKVPAASFWGEHSNLVEATLGENSRGVSLHVAEVLAAATAKYRRKFDFLDEHQRSSLLALAEQDAEHRQSDDVLLIACPACGTEAALLEGENSIEVDVEVDHRDGTVTGGRHYVEFQAGSLECLACGLELDGQEDLEAAGVETLLPNDTIDSDRLLREYYGDDY